MIVSLPSLKETTSQTAGPYVHIGLIPHQAGFDIFEKNFSNVLVGPETQGERIRIEGRIFDGLGSVTKDILVEIWQANAAGRYRHDGDRHPAPLDPNFSGAGRCVTDAEGRFRFVTVRPGAYPWRNHHNAWRPAHIHFSVVGRSFLQRLVTQMYFPGDPLLALDPILGSVPAAARGRLVARLDLDATVPEWALGYRWDIVVAGRAATPLEDQEDQG